MIEETNIHGENPQTRAEEDYNENPNEQEVDLMDDIRYKHIIYSNTTYIPFDSQNLVETEILASLTLQKVLYCNIIYDIVFAYMN